MIHKSAKTQSQKDDTHGDNTHRDDDQKKDSQKKRLFNGDFLKREQEKEHDHRAVIQETSTRADIREESMEAELEDAIAKLKHVEKELEEMKEEKEKALQEAKKQVEALTEMSKRALADLANFKKRNEDDKKSFVQFANATLLREILEITDNFERAFAHMPSELSNNDWVKGILNIEKKLSDILVKQGLGEIQALGKKIDPNIHEAMMTGPGEKDMIIEVFEKGYMLGDRVLRPAKVKVGNGT